MAASLFVAQRITALLLALVFTLTVDAGCMPAHDDGGAGTLVAVTGDFLADGTCHARVGGAALFAPSDGQRTAYDAGPMADVAPAGYTLRQLTCAPAGAGSALSPERGAERMVLVTVYARADAPLRVGRYAIRSELAATDDSADAGSRAGIAVFGAPGPSRRATGAGVRYLEGREGTLTITSVAPGADGGHVIGTFSMRAGPAWSM